MQSDIRQFRERCLVPLHLMNHFAALGTKAEELLRRVSVGMPHIDTGDNWLSLIDLLQIIENCHHAVPHLTLDAWQEIGRRFRHPSGRSLAGWITPFAGIRSALLAAPRRMRHLNNYIQLRPVLIEPGRAELIVHVEPAVIQESPGSAIRFVAGLLESLAWQAGAERVQCRVLSDQALLGNVTAMMYAHRELHLDEKDHTIYINGEAIARRVQLGSQRIGPYTVHSTERHLDEPPWNAIQLTADLHHDDQLLLRQGEIFDTPYGRVRLTWKPSAIVSQVATRIARRMPAIRQSFQVQAECAAATEKQLFDAESALYRVRATRSEIVAGRQAIEGYARTLEKKIGERNATLRQVQASLQRSHVELHQLFNIGIPLCLIDRRLTIIRVNDSFCTYFGLRKEEVIGRPCQDVVRSSMCRSPQCLFKQVVGGMNFCEFEEDILVRGSKTVSCMVTAVPFRREDGELVGIVENFIDIARLKRAENSLRSSEEKYRRLLETSNDIILATNEVGAISYINQAGVTRSGHTLPQLLGRHVIELIPQYRFLPPSASETEAANSTQHLQTASIIGAEGRRIPVELSASMLSERGRFSGMLLYARDISERIIAARRIQDSLREKEALLKEIHHRVKNNLQIISSLLDLAGNRAESSAVATALAAARSKIFAMAIIHSQLYQSDRFDRIDMDRHVQDLAVNLATIYGGEKPVRLHSPNSGVCLSVTQAIPCALVLNELISNAYRHAFTSGRAGSITVRLSQNPEGWLTIEVIDDGCGIPETVDLRQTTSLGLKLVRNLVSKQLRGRLEISQSGGTHVRIVFKILEDGAPHEKNPDR